ncbi:MAG: peptidase T, partial [Nitrospinota bacterium]
GVEWIASDGTTTLGADDKAGVAAIIDVLSRITGKGPGFAVRHGTIEVPSPARRKRLSRGPKI